MSVLAERITVDPEVCNGKPTIREKRITVETVLEFLANGDSPEEILEAYPTLEKDDILACIRFASALMKNSFEVGPVLA